MKITELVKYDSGLKIVKNPEWPEEILAISALDALLPQSLIFIKNAKFFNRFREKLSQAAELKVGAVVDEKFFAGLTEEQKSQLEKLSWMATSPNVALSLTQLSRPFYERRMKGMNTQVDGRQMGSVEIDPTAIIAQNVFIGENVKIGARAEILAGCVILPNVEIGENTKLYPNVTVYSFTTIGRDCRIHSGTVIGSDGYGYTFHEGKHLKIWHMGGVNIHDDVEIGSNCSIDQGTFSPTVIGSGTRIDNLCQIAHNTKIGRGCIICGQSGVAGSATLEDYVVMGGKSGVGPDAHIGRGSQIAGASGVADAVVLPPGSKVGGYPARDIREWMKGLAYIRKMSLKETK